jgi:hypothetical protein
MASVLTLLLTDDVTTCCSPLTGGSLDPAAADEAVDATYHETDLREHSELLVLTRETLATVPRCEDDVPRERIPTHRDFADPSREWTLTEWRISERRHAGVHGL